LNLRPIGGLDAGSLAGQRRDGGLDAVAAGRAARRSGASARAGSRPGAVGSQALQLARDSDRFAREVDAL
jgi:hypothetical protein